MTLYCKPMQFHCTAPAYLQNNDKAHFETLVRIMHAEITTAAAFATNDSFVRSVYQTELTKTIQSLRQAAVTRKISWGEAARQASGIRNETMQVLRGRSSPVGRAFAEKLKAKGLSFNDLIDQKTAKNFGSKANFHNLSASDKNFVYRSIVESADRPRASINQTMRHVGTVGRGLIVLSLSVSVYNIAVAEDKLAATAEEGSTLIGGVAGGAAGGALAGLACGPGAPVCVTIGAFVGGALGAFGVSLFW